MSEKTEQPTQKRLNKARREGNVPVSAGILQATAFVVGLALVPAMIHALASEFVSTLRQALSAQSPIPVGTAASAIWLPVLRVSVPMLVAVFAVVALVGGVQTQGMFSVTRLKPDLSRFSLGSLGKVLFSPQRAFAVLRSFVAVTLVAWLIIVKLKEHMLDLARSAGNLDAALTAGGQISLEVARAVAAVLVVLAAIDWAVTYRGWRSRLKMTKDEVKRETKESEGDPQLKSQREQLHQELLASATTQAVHEATVVIVNPTHVANALRYDEQQDEAPLLMAKGSGALAKRIMDEAYAMNIPVKQDIPLARALYELPEGEPIPSELYEAVAIVLQEVFAHQPDKSSQVAGVGSSDVVESETG